MRLRLALCCLLAALTLAPAAAQVAPHAGMLRYPDVSATHIAFLYANDLWLVPREGGVATPLASPPGEERFPRFSPDGQQIAFMGNYDGGSDLYTLPVAGGVPFRVTHHPTTEVLVDWTQDGRLIFYAGGVEEYPRAQELFTVSAEGGLPAKLPVPYGANGRISPDGQWLAYTPHSRDHRPWKRYRGGMATDIWLFHLKDHTSQKITDWEGTDSQPMWQGETIYYLSDNGPAHRLNIWAYDTASGERRQVTRHQDYDVKWPSIGPGPAGQGEIVYQLGPELRLLDLASGDSRVVEVTIPGARPRLRPQRVDASENIFSRALSPSAKRVAVGARGDIWTLPAEEGSPRNLTRTSGVGERSPVWSPDGQLIAYASHAGADGYELWVTEPGGLGEPRKLTSLGSGFLFDPVFSPDSKKIAFWDQTSTLYVHDLEAETTRKVDRLPGNNRSPVSWSPDSAWLAYAKGEELVRPSSVWLYNLEEGESHQVTHGMFNDTWPTFDRDGKYLFLASQREISEPIYEDLGTTWVYSHTDRLYLVPLAADAASPLAPESDEEKAKGEEDGEGEKNGKDDEKNGEDESPEPVKIDLEGFEHRMVPIPVERGNFAFLAVNDQGQLLYARFPRGGGPGSIHLVDLSADEGEMEKTVLSETGQFELSADGAKLLAVAGPRMAIVDARPEQKLDKTVSTDGMIASIEPREEWRQIFDEAWRIERDFFYDPNMHGVDWEGVKRQYGAMLDDCASREDLSFIITEMISELNVGHSYYSGGDTEETPDAAVGMLGARFELADGAYRIARIYEGGPWDADARGPLSQPGVDVGVGDYLLAVNGVPMDTSRDPWASLLGLAGRTVTLTVSDKPTLDETARQVTVELLEEENPLVYRAWVEKNRRYVDEASGGKVGYIYVPNTGIRGQNELVRQFFGQLHKAALIIDERWNGGGQIPTRFIELLNRPLANYWALRGDDDVPWPPDAHQGPKCMLINGLAGSGGDYFPFWFRAAGVGKLIGTRTWGGLVGIGGYPLLVDGAVVTAPRFAFFEKDGTWGIEGHGVDPDIEVVDDPALMVDGSDPQLDAAIALMLEEIEAHGYHKPPRPAYPDRSGMGITEADH